MLKLETLGGLTLIDAGGRHVAPQRRRLALLALLAAAGERGISRDKVVACLWPESAGDNARHALEQLLYSMRRQLPQVVVQGSDPLRLDPAVVRTDVAEFTARMAAGDLAGAAAVYRGPFLDGFFLSGAPEFERWAERERARLAVEHERALRLLAEKAGSEGRHTDEIDLKRRLALADPLGERSATDLVRALAASGDWVGAARAAREYATRKSAGVERLSASGIMLGMPAYTSPEQARGSRALDGRTDIYSLGCVLYEMLGGEPPFTGANRAAVLARHIADTTPPLRTIRPDVPPAVERAVLRCLAKQPEERFPTAGELAAALREA